MIRSFIIGKICGTLNSGINDICVAYNGITKAHDISYNSTIKSATAKTYVVDMTMFEQPPLEELILSYQYSDPLPEGASSKLYPQDFPTTLDELLVPIHTIYIDMDEVIVNFKKAIIKANPQADVERMYEVSSVVGMQRKLMSQWIPNMIKTQAFATAEPLPLFYILRDKLIPYWKSLGIDVQILSSLSSDVTVQSTIATQKLRWIQNNNVDIKFNFVKGASLKQEFAKRGTLLLDDYQRTINQFIKAGGCALLVTEDISSVMKKLSLLGLCPKE